MTDDNEKEAAWLELKNYMISFAILVVAVATVFGGGTFIVCIVLTLMGR